MWSSASKILLYLLFALLLRQSYGQNGLDHKTDLSGSFTLHQLLDSLDKHLSVAYSADKLPSTAVTLQKGLSIRQILDKMEGLRLLTFNLSGDQLIVSPYKRKSYSINGTLRDLDTGEDIIGASIQLMGTNNGTHTNGYGYFSITLLEGTYQVQVSHIGYETQTREITLTQNVNLSLSMPSSARLLRDIEVSSRPTNLNITETLPSINRIFVSDTDLEIPYLLGEVDVTQNALLQPGIKTIGEDASGIHVRGGGVDQNLILLDEAPIYNPNHFNGLISAFNPEAVNDIRILKGFIPPSYGGRGSSVIEVRQKEGNDTETQVSGGVGPVSVRALVEGPIKKNQSSYLLSVRQSLLSLSLQDFSSTSVRRNRNRFQDINLKINTRPNDHNQLYLSGYFGNDRNAVGLNSVRRWGNRLLTLRWNHVYSPQLFSNISAYASQYNYRIENDDEPGAFVGRSNIRDLGLKADFAYTFQISNEINFGAHTTYHRLAPGSREPLSADAQTNTIRLEPERGLESALYASHSFALGKAYFDYGFRYSMLHTFGPGKVYLYEGDQPTADTAVIDTLQFSSREVIQNFKNLEPRASLVYVFNPTISLKSSFSRNVQYLHLISNTLSPAPTDIWKLTDRYIPPLIADQYTLGVFKNLDDNRWETSMELYYKNIQNNIQYKDGADLIFNENIETEILLGRARAYGLELFLKKKQGRLKGWIAYTLSRAEGRLGDDDRTPYVLENHDKTHDFSTSWTYRISDRISASANFIYNTGIPVTLPTDKYIFEGNLVPHFSERNNARLPDYHRLDVSLKINGKKSRKDGSPKKNQAYWIVSVYNAYARKNAYSYFFRESELNPGLGEVVQYSIFGIAIPGITYNFSF